MIRRTTIAGIGLFFVSVCLTIPLGSQSLALAQTANRTTDPAKSLPLDQLAPRDRESVAEVIGNPTFHRRGQPDSFPCNPRLYLALVNQPLLTLALWKDLSPSPVTLREITPGNFQGSNNNGAEVGGRFLIRTPSLHLVLSNFTYNGPRGNLRLDGRIVIVLRTAYFKEPQGEYWVRHDLEVFVKIDTRGWRALARSARPIVEKYLEDQVQEGGWFVSLMSRLVVTYPNWAGDVAQNQNGVPLGARKAFLALVAQLRKPDASPGRPQVVAENSDSPPPQRR